MSDSTPSCATTNLLTWKDPVKTGKVFGSIVVGLIVLKTVDLISLFFRLAYLGLLASAAVEYAGKLVTGTGFVTKYKPAVKSYAKEINDRFLPVIADYNVKAEAESHNLVFAKNVETTLKAAGVAYVLYKITSFFSLFTLVATGVVVAFTAPAIYTTYKKEIDAAVAEYSKCAKSKASEVYATAHKSASPYVDDLIKKTGPVGSFISSKIPTRTAGSTVGDSRAATYGTGADEPAVATTTGASKFPEVPTSDLNSATTKDVVDDIKSTIDSEQLSNPTF